MSETSLDPSDALHRGRPITVDRYRGATRVNHWVTALSLVLLALSGLSMFHPSLFFLTAIFGGGPNAFSRYENGKTEPPLALVKLLMVLDRHPNLLGGVRGGH